jgi:hypothetical protein
VCERLSEAVYAAKGLKRHVPARPEGEVPAAEAVADADG